ncbi:hypothetical protein BJ508DRAFT_365922 [Ascobolus immersus RN42]|uniref:Uncharacterized protein n=1 Tax=Ascobolus immersus RN42 TaxID=1160509 RepID=A0A3N4HZB9_ASCIM|nr:hypothetical protein BJ508DRAFT_365922 [Ascobolus immersus RN42]
MVVFWEPTVSCLRIDDCTTTGGFEHHKPEYSSADQGHRGCLQRDAWDENSRPHRPGHAEADPVPLSFDYRRLTSTGLRLTPHDSRTQGILVWTRLDHGNGFYPAALCRDPALNLLSTVSCMGLEQEVRIPYQTRLLGKWVISIQNTTTNTILALPGTGFNGGLDPEPVGCHPAVLAQATIFRFGCSELQIITESSLFSPRPAPLLSTVRSESRKWEELD